MVDHIGMIWFTTVYHNMLDDNWERYEYKPHQPEIIRNTQESRKVWYVSDMRYAILNYFNMDVPAMACASSIAGDHTHFSLHGRSNTPWLWGLWTDLAVEETDSVRWGSKTFPNVLFWEPRLQRSTWNLRAILPYPLIYICICMFHIRSFAVCFWLGP